MKVGLRMPLCTDRRGAPVPTVGMRVRYIDARSKASRSSMLETYRGGSENIRRAINVAFIPVRDNHPSAQGTWQTDRGHREADQTILFTAPYDLSHSFTKSIRPKFSMAALTEKRVELLERALGKGARS